MWVLVLALLLDILVSQSDPLRNRVSDGSPTYLKGFLGEDSVKYKSTNMTMRLNNSSY